MNTPLYIHGRTDVGMKRSRNEDSFGIEPRGTDSHLLVVCDGMGGHGGGDVASRHAVESIISDLSDDELPNPPAALFEALQKANTTVMDVAQTSSDPGMGTTAVISWIHGRSCWVGWVGDSRFYHFRGGEVVERSVDHTRVQKMVELGILTPEQAHTHPDAHVLTQAIGGGDGREVHPSVWNEPQELQDGDVLLLCSDGLYDMVDDAELYPLIAERSYEQAVEQLIAVANGRGGVDNITVILCVVGQSHVPPRAAGGVPAAEPAPPTSDRSSPLISPSVSAPEPAVEQSTPTPAPTPQPTPMPTPKVPWWKTWRLLLPIAGLIGAALVVVVAVLFWTASGQVASQPSEDVVSTEPEDAPDAVPAQPTADPALVPLPPGMSAPEPLPGGMVPPIPVPPEPEPPSEPPATADPSGEGDAADEGEAAE